MTAIALIFVFALFDTVSTICFTHYGLATEVNPLMDWFIEVDPLLFISFKMTLTTLVVLWLYRWRYRPRARLLAKATAVFYGAIAVLHCITYVHYGSVAQLAEHLVLTQ